MKTLEEHIQTILDNTNNHKFVKIEETLVLKKGNKDKVCVQYTTNKIHAFINFHVHITLSLCKRSRDVQLFTSLTKQLDKQTFEQYKQKLLDRFER